MKRKSKEEGPRVKGHWAKRLMGLGWGQPLAPPPTVVRMLLNTEV